MTSSWDDAVLGDDFVRGAAVREPSAAERAAARPPRPPRGPRDRRGAVAIVLTVVLLAVAVVWGGLLDLSGPRVVPAAAAQDAPPVPADAADSPLGRPPAVPAGDGGYAFLVEDRGEPLRFDPCRPVHWVMRPDLAPGDALPLLERGFAELSRATGLQFTYDGPTDEGPSDERLEQLARYGDRWAPVLVTWSNERLEDDLEGPVAGFAGPRAGEDGGLHLVTGEVVLDADQLTGRGGQASRGALATVLHELGHLVGLDHVDDPAQLMHATSVGQQGYADGDLRGLAVLGSGPCGDRT